MDSSYLIKQSSILKVMKDSGVGDDKQLTMYLLVINDGHGIKLRFNGNRKFLFNCLEVINIMTTDIIEAEK